MEEGVEGGELAWVEGDGLLLVLVLVVVVVEVLGSQCCAGIFCMLFFLIIIEEECLRSFFCGDQSNDSILFFELVDASCNVHVSQSSIECAKECASVHMNNCICERMHTRPRTVHISQFVRVDFAL